MSRKISFTKAERQALFDVVADEAHRGNAALASLLAKMDEAAKPDASGLPVQTFLDVCQSVLGDRLALPPKPTSQWYGRIGRALKESGLDEAGARAVALAAKASAFRGPVSLEYIASRISTLLARAKEDGGPSSKPAGGWTGRKEFDG